MTDNSPWYENHPFNTPHNRHIIKDWMTRATAELTKLHGEIDAAMVVLNPNMPESGIEDAARQVMQVIKLSEGFMDMTAPLLKERLEFIRAFDAWAMSYDHCSGDLFHEMLEARGRLEWPSSGKTSEVSRGPVFKAVEDVGLPDIGVKVLAVSFSEPKCVVVAKRVTCNLGNDTVWILFQGPGANIMEDLNYNRVDFNCLKWCELPDIIEDANQCKPESGKE